MNCKLRSLVAAAVAGSFMLGFGANAVADSTDDIVNALIAKGVLTEEEGALLMKGRTGEKEAAAKKKDSEIKASFKDGIKFESGDKANSLEINGRVQLDYRTFGDSNRATSVADTFDVRRAYLSAKGKFAKYYEFGVVTDFASADSTKDKSAQLDEAYINLHYWDQAQFKFGQFKMPFSLEEQTSSRFIDFQERSMVNAYAPAKEIGAMIHGTPTTGMTYGLAFSTGEGKNTIEHTDPKNKQDGVDVIGRVTANFAEIMGNKDNVYHVGAAFTNGKLNKYAPSNSTEGKGEKFFSATYDAASAANFGTTGDIERTRYGLEGALALGPVKLQSEWVRTNIDGETNTKAKFDDNIDAWYAEALWMITGENYADSYKGGKFDRIKPKNNFNPDAPGMGAWEIGVRYTQLDASDLNSGAVKVNNQKNMTAAAFNAATSASTLEADAWTVGVKWIPMPNWRFLANYVRTDYDTSIKINGKKFDSEDAFTVRAQMDF